MMTEEMNLKDDRPGRRKDHYGSASIEREKSEGRWKLNKQEK